MKHLQRRLQRLEQRVYALPVPQPDADADNAFAAWCRGGCLGPLPSAGPRPVKYGNEAEWQQEHRLLLALCCRSVGRPDPPEMTAEERREIDDTVAFFASIDPDGELSLPQQARLAPYTSILAQLQNAPQGETIPTIPDGRESC